MLVTLIDNVVVPLFLNGEAKDGELADIYCNDTLMNGLATLGLTTGLTQADGNVEVGIGQLRWDLNEVLPTLLHWLLGDNDYTYTYYNISEADGVYTYGEPVVGALGTKYTDDGSDNVDETETEEFPLFLTFMQLIKSLQQPL